MEREAVRYCVSVPSCLVRDTARVKIQSESGASTAANATRNARSPAISVTPRPFKSASRIAFTPCVSGR